MEAEKVEDLEVVEKAVYLAEVKVEVEKVVVTAGVMVGVTVVEMAEETVVVPAVVMEVEHSVVEMGVDLEVVDLEEEKEEGSVVEGSEVELEYNSNDNDEVDTGSHIEHMYCHDLCSYNKYQNHYFVHLLCWFHQFVLHPNTP